MKTCSAFRIEIALSASGAETEQPTNELRDHLAQCGPCREYAKEIGGVCDLLFSAAAARVLQEPVTSQRSRSPRVQANEAGREFRWKWGVGWGLAVMVVLIFAGLFATRVPSRKAEVTSGYSTRPAATLLNYQTAVCNSEETLHAFMRAQARTNLGSRPSVTMLTRSDEEF